jgi:glycosyltransferase involved in cell wall biosynthesis
MGGALEIVDSSCGILAEPQDSKGLASSLKELIEKPELRHRLGAAGRDRALTLCNPASQMAALQGLLGTKAGQGEQP